jgi:hypothetical protein
MALTVTVVEKPVGGVQLSDIDPELIKLFEANIPQCLYVDPTKELDPKTAGNKANIMAEPKELQFDADTKDEAEKAAGYARAWGARQTPKLEIRRVGAKLQGQPSTRVRLTVKLFDPNAPRPGRPASTPAS